LAGARVYWYAEGRQVRKENKKKEKNGEGRNKNTENVALFFGTLK